MARARPRGGRRAGARAEPPVAPRAAVPGAARVPHRAAPRPRRVRRRGRASPAARRPASPSSAGRPTRAAAWPRGRRTSRRWPTPARWRPPRPRSTSSSCAGDCCRPRRRKARGDARAAPGGRHAGLRGRAQPRRVGRRAGRFADGGTVVINPARQWLYTVDAKAQAPKAAAAAAALRRIAPAWPPRRRSGRKKLNDRHAGPRVPGRRHAGGRRRRRRGARARRASRTRIACSCSPTSRGAGGSRPWSPRARHARERRAGPRHVRGAASRPRRQRPRLLLLRRRRGSDEFDARPYARPAVHRIPPGPRAGGGGARRRAARRAPAPPREGAAPADPRRRARASPGNRPLGLVPHDPLSHSLRDGAANHTGLRPVRGLRTGRRRGVPRPGPRSSATWARTPASSSDSGWRTSKGAVDGAAGRGGRFASPDIVTMRAPSACLVPLVALAQWYGSNDNATTHGHHDRAASGFLF